MMRARVVPFSPLALALAVLLFTCTSAPPPGDLSVTILGLPSGVAGAVQVSGKAFAASVTATATLSGLAAGTYTIAPGVVTLRRSAFDATASSASVNVPAGATASVTITYQVRPGTLWVTELGSGSGGAVTGYASLDGTPQAGTRIDLNGAYATAFDADGNLWIGDTGPLVAYLASSLDSTPQPNATTTDLYNPWSVAFDAAGNLWVSDLGSHSVVEYTASSLDGTPPIGTRITGFTNPYGLAFDANGNLWVADFDGGEVVEYLASSLESTHDVGATITGLDHPASLAFDPPPYPVPLSHRTTP